MKIGIQTWGSDGDILPFIALARGLDAAGHDVSLVYTSVDNKDYASYAENSSISIARSHGGFEAPREEVLAAVLNTRNPLKALALTLQTCFDPAVEEMYASAKQLCTDCELVIGHVIHYPLAIAAEKSGCPRVSVALCPLMIASEYASPLGENLGRWLNPVLWKLADFIALKMIYGPARRLRRREGLRPYRDLQAELYVSAELTLVAACDALCPRLPDWGGHIQVCGFLNPLSNTADWVMPTGMRTFLEEGPPPVYLTFGSLTQFDVERTTRLLWDAAEVAGVRAIIQSDWNSFKPAKDDPNIFKVQCLPHACVFPRCSMVVHHGGSGTTQSSLWAGKPSLVVAHAFDQPYWGKRMHQIGVAGKVLHRRSTTAARIAESIQKILNEPQLSLRAEEIGRSMRMEDGVGKAVALIEERFG